MLIDLLESSKAIGLCPMGILLEARLIKFFLEKYEKDRKASLCRCFVFVCVVFGRFLLSIIPSTGHVNKLSSLWYGVVP